MMSQRYGVHAIVDKKKTTLDAWEKICEGFKKYGVDIEDDTQFIQGFGDCYITDLIYEQACSVIKCAHESGMVIQDIVSDEKDPDWIFRREDDEKATVGSILSIFEKYNLAVVQGIFENDGDYEGE